jgi:hypothetical protein
MTVLMAPVRLRAVASDLMIEKVRSMAIPCSVACIFPCCGAGYSWSRHSPSSRR